MAEDKKPKEVIDASFAAIEIENIRSWRKLSLGEKLRANEEMNSLFETIIEEKRALGKPFIHPETQELTY